MLYLLICDRDLGRAGLHAEEWMRITATIPHAYSWINTCACYRTSCIVNIGGKCHGLKATPLDTHTHTFLPFSCRFTATRPPQGGGGGRAKLEFPSLVRSAIVDSQPSTTSKPSTYIALLHAVPSRASVVPGCTCDASCWLSDVLHSSHCIWLLGCSWASCW